MRLRPASWVSVFTLTMGFSLTASAQPATAVTPPPESAPESAPATSNAAAPTAPPPAPDGGHFRWGLSPMAGTFFPGPTTIAFGIEGRVGYAFNQTVTAFGSLGAVGGVGFGGSASSTGASASVSAVSYWYLGANVDALVAGPLFVGGGAAIGRGGWGVVSAAASSSGGSQEVIAAGGLMPQFNARLGLATGTPSPTTGKRSGFSVALDLRVLVAPDSVSTKQSAGAGGATQSVTTNTTEIGISPMLMLGYEQR
jgi:hypothetical protein